MPCGWFKENRQIVYGEDMNIYFCEYLDDECKILVGKIRMPIDRFKDLIEFHYQELIDEAYSGVTDAE